ncbi:MAG: dCTP deaminase [Candidatus Aenigmarchaeota archaeon]|nr:dCTP deaminase [Candidatus Aenigmarchaeota archaeon]
MLSNVSIKKFMESGDIVVDPWNGEMMGAARITLHLGENILMPEGNAVVDVLKGVLPDYTKIEITKEKPFLLKPGIFVIGETFEKIGISEKIGMLLDGRSTLARVGLTVTQTAMIVDTGQKPKTMTLEIKNDGPNTILLYPKMKFCRACFFLIEPAATTRYDVKGKYLAGDMHKPIFRKELKE